MDSESRSTGSRGRPADDQGTRGSGHGKWRRINLLDEKYWHGADVPIRDIHSANTVGGPDRYTRPGRNFSISINYRF